VILLNPTYSEEVGTFLDTMRIQSQLCVASQGVFMPESSLSALGTCANLHFRVRVQLTGR
jgi:hypothetical protein